MNILIFMDNQTGNTGSQNQPVKITITLPMNSYFLSGIRDFTLSLIRNMTEFSEQWAFRFQSVVDELCNNAIEHGSAPGDDIKIIFISKPHDSIEIIVEDTNHGKNPTTAQDLKNLIQERRKPGYIYRGIRGRGLAKIVAEWTDELEFIDLKNSGLSVRVKKYLSDPKLHEMSRYLESPAHIVLK